MSKVHLFGQIKPTSFLYRISVAIFILVCVTNFLFAIGLIEGALERTIILHLIGIATMSVTFILHKRRILSKTTLHSGFALLNGIISAIGLIVYYALGEAGGIYYEGTDFGEGFSLAMTFALLLVTVCYFVLAIFALYYSRKHGLSNKITANSVFKNEPASALERKEQCFDKIDRMYSYYEHGSITKEEFEQFKTELLNSINASTEESTIVQCSEIPQGFKVKTTEIDKAEYNSQFSECFDEKAKQESFSEEDPNKVKKKKEPGQLWMIFYIYIRFPLGFLISLGNMITTYTNEYITYLDADLIALSFIIDATFYVISILTFIFMVKRQERGYQLNNVLLVGAPLVYFIIMLFTGITATTLGAFLGSALFSILNLVYFKKRKHLFENI